jgi:hypothetical protein
MKLFIMIRSNRFKCLVVIFIISLALIATLFQHWEPSGETAGYWLFARIFRETGKFTIIDRGPIYVLYLNLFNVFKYPNSIIVEYLLTTYILVTTLIFFFKPYLGLFLSVFASILWIPFFQIAEPPVQKFALALSLWAYIIRNKSPKRFQIILSYSLLILAYIFRSTYLYYLLVFLIWDIINLIRQKKLSLYVIKPDLKNDWPLICTIILYISIQIIQSPSPWNNIYFSTIPWYPVTGKTMEIIQGYNMQYILQKYGTYWDHDWYFTNNEVFNGAKTTLGAILANPKYVFEQMVYFINFSIPMLTGMTEIPGYLSAVTNTYLTNILILVILFITSLLSIKNKLLFPLIIGNVTILLLSIVARIPEQRYLFPLVPIYTLSALWFIRLFNRLIFPKKYLFNPSTIFYFIEKHLRSIISVSFSMIILFNFTSGPSLHSFYDMSRISWPEIFTTIFSDIKSGDLKIMEIRAIDRYSSLRKSLSTINSLIKNCHGVMSEELTFIGAFTDLPLNHNFEISEIPPFGYLGDPAYDGLNLNRVDCVLVSTNLKLYEGAATNVQMRRDYYVYPYIEKLKEMGAVTYNIDGYGQAYILPSRL